MHKQRLVDVAPWGLPRPEPWNGLALRGGARDAGAKGRAVGRSLIPIALRHGLAIGIVVLAAAFLGMTVPLAAIGYSVAAIFPCLGIFCLIRHQHPRWVRVQVGFRDLTLLSFLMASAHGAGLMVVPVLLGSATVEAQDRVGATTPCLPPPTR
jgi:hypothetical protein